MNATDEKRLVLIVDDAPTNLQMVRSILKDDFKIRVATSGAKALDLVKAKPHPAGPNPAGCHYAGNGRLRSVRHSESHAGDQGHSRDLPYREHRN